MCGVFILILILLFYKHVKWNFCVDSCFTYFLKHSSSFYIFMISLHDIYRITHVQRYNNYFISYFIHLFQGFVISALGEFQLIIWFTYTVGNMYEVKLNVLCYRK